MRARCSSACCSRSLSKGAGGGQPDATLLAFQRALLGVRGAGYDIVLFFISLGTLVNCYLLLVSRYVPRALSALGIASFVVMAAGSLSNLLLVERLSFTTALYLPGIVFEMAIGVWLLAKGVDRRAVEAWPAEGVRAA